jgi:hypothetical protein
VTASPTLDSPGAAAAARRHADADHRVGVLAGVAAYSLWGVFPLVFHLLEAVAPVEILMHRIVWSFAVVLGLLVLRHDRGWFRSVRSLPGRCPASPWRRPSSPPTGSSTSGP